MTADGVTGQPRQAAMVFIFITILLDMLSLGIIIPVWPRLVVNFLAILELAREQLLELAQAEPYAPIYVQRKGDPAFILEGEEQS